MSRRSSSSRCARPIVAMLMAAVAILTAGCGTTAPTPAPPTPSPSFDFYTPGPSPTAEDPAAVYARIEAQVQQIRGLTAKTTVDPIVLDQKALDDALRIQFDKDNPAPLIVATQRIDRALGLIPASASLRDLELELLSGQVVGFYDSDTKRMSVKSVTGAIGVGQQITFAHEFDHALQDQTFDLSKLGIDAPDQGDRALARLALVEGDATVLMSDWAQSALTPLQMLQYLSQSDLTGQQAILAKMPAALKAQLLFPYTSGLGFVQGLENKGGWDAVDQAFGAPPDSTEQILHPAKYAAHEPPVTIAIPADLASRLGDGWTVDAQDTIGEFGLQTWLESVGGLAAGDAGTAADGWGGDRLVLVSHGADFAIAIQTVWDTPADATAFAAAATTTRAKLAGSTAVIDPGTTSKVTVFVGSTDAAIQRLAGALGLAG
jgi:hypothetical protein